MAEAGPLAGNLSLITTTEDFDVSPLSVRDSSIASSHSRRQPRTQHAGASGKSGWSSQPTRHRFSLALGEHSLSAVIHTPLFRDLSASEFKEVAGAGQERIFSHNQSLFSEGAPLRSVFIVTSGHAKMIRHGVGGEPFILHISGPGDVLDGLGCSSKSIHSAEARAVRHCRVFSWDVGRFESLSRRFPALGHNSARLLLGRLRVLEGRIHELATERVPQRLAKILLRLILQGQGAARSPWIDLTGEDLAQMAGTTQFTVSRLLCDWAAQRIIQPRRTAILVENLPGLIAIAMQAARAE